LTRPSHLLGNVEDSGYHKGDPRFRLRTSRP
jgi:hypothetical protein